MKTCPPFKRYLLKIIFLFFLLTSFLFLFKNNSFAIGCGTPCNSSDTCQGATDGCTECRDPSLEQITGYTTCQEPLEYEKRHEQTSDSGGEILIEKANIMIEFPSLVNPNNCQFSECKKEASPERDPRPAKGDVCSENDLFTPSCASSFGVYDTVDFQGENRPYSSWEESIFIDPTGITIPFVGKKNKESWEFWEISNASEAKYITDYIEGTNEYYRNYGNLNTITNHQGILRKLTPFEYQNQLKKNLIKRAHSEYEGLDKIHDYNIKYISRICWDFPAWMDAGKFISDIAIDHSIDKIGNIILNILGIEGEFDLELPDIGHYCLYASKQEGDGQWAIVKGDDLIGMTPAEGLKDFLFALSDKIPGFVHFYDLEGAEQRLSAFLNENGSLNEKLVPPSSDNENYEEEFKAWEKRSKNGEKGYWYRLWQAVPMLSREDTAGKINPYLGKEKDSDIFEIDEESQINAVPHLARLYEGSREINNILIPFSEEKKIEMVQSEAYPESNPPETCLKENYIPTGDEGDSLCCGLVKAKITTQEETESFAYPCSNPVIQNVGAGVGEENLNICYKKSKDISREIGVNLEHPYLDEIWSYTANANGGFFNVFRPYSIPNFEDISTVTDIYYKSSSSEISPEKGSFYFPHLGGIQKAKEWVVNEVLRPYVDN